MKGSNGKIVQVLNVFKDITERKRMEEMLKERNWELDERVKELNCLYGISKLVDQPGISLDGILQGIVNLIPPAWQHPEVACARVIVGDDVFETENFRETEWRQSSDIVVNGVKAGALDVFYLKETPDFDAGPFLREERNLNEAITKQLGATIERKRARERITESEERYKTVVESSMDGICVISNTAFVYANQKMADIYGIDNPDELVGQSIIDFIVPEEKERIAELCSNMEAGGTQADFYYTKIVRADNKIRETEISSRLIEFLGQPARLCIWRDVTDRTVLRRQLEWEKFRVERSEELERLRSNFLSIVSHELRTPLVSIKGYTELIRSGRVGEVPERLDEMLKVVERNADRLSNLTDDLLDQQRLESGRLKINPEKLKLQNIIKEVVEEVQPFIIEKNQVLNIQVPDDLAPVKADKIRMTQVLLNLLNNASKFSPLSGSISLQVREISEMVEVQVSDSGIGIAKEDLDKLFKPFPDIQKTAYYKGTGLGLSICKGIIDLHGGRIWAESEGDGRGAKFTFTIPKQSGD